MPQLRLVIGFLLLGSSANAADKFSDTDLEFFESKIRPLLSEHCYECHSSENEIEGGLRVDFREGLLKGGDTGPAVVPGKPDASRMIDAIGYDDVDLEMPPEGKLPQKEIDLLTEWVKRGSPWPEETVSQAKAIEKFDLQKRKSEHWCWQPITNPAPPELTNEQWARSSIDRFVLEKLEENDIAPTHDADRITLLRRAYFDLIGLPPTPAQVDEFLSDQSDTAFESVVDELLESPHFGERWARHWMDLFRYAESHGHEFDYPIHHAYEYRDYLIRAFNADVPYDDFIVEQIAGDLVSEPRLHPATRTNESVIGTAFWWLGEATHSPVTVRGDEAIRIDNQIDVLSKSFLALTVSCARCHDHKFDAIAANDYYAMAGVLQSSRRTETLLDPGGKIAEAVAKLEVKQAEGDRLVQQVVGEYASDISGRLKSYLLAAHEVIYGDPQSPNEVSEPVVFEDFEKPNYEGWDSEGNAFGDRPLTRETVSPIQGDLKAKGNGFVNSFNVRIQDENSSGDRATGKLTSRPFKIQHRFIHFLIGGGKTAGKTCLNVLVNGKVVGSQAGFNSNEMRPVYIDVSEYVGSEAVIQIVDDHQGGWGNVGVDHIEFRDQRKQTRRSSKVVAQARQLDVARLNRFVDLLQSDAIRSAEHPLFLWNRLASSGKFEKENFAEVKRAVEVVSEKREAIEASHSKFADFSEGIPEGWFTTGEAFTEPKRSDIVWRWEDGYLSVGDGRGVSSRTFGRKLSGTLRSPTFELAHDQIQILARGSGVKARLIIDGYYMFDFNGLLFRGVSADVRSETDMRWMALGGDIRRYKGHSAYIEFIDNGGAWIDIAEVRFSDKGAPPLGHSRLTQHLVAQPTPNSLDELAQAFADTVNEKACRSELFSILGAGELLAESAPESQTLLTLHHDMVQIVGSAPEPKRVLGLVDGTPENERIFIRGSHRTLGDEAPRQLLEALVGKQSKPSDGSGRLMLAQQIASAENPLTTRVVVNRIWHHLFGRGIVPSTDNFGVLGQLPTHPKLLDHLAQRFVAGKWSMKGLIKEVMLTRTYQMDSTPVARSTEIDPTNMYLHRQRIRRLQGEAIRDSILAVSGRLDRKQFGPSVPVHLTSFMSGRGRPGSGPLDGNGRRSIYSSVRRNFLSPMMLAFDTPIPFTSIGRRNVSNVPAQALILMNSPFVIEQSKVWGKRVLEDGSKSIEERIRSMYLRAFSRDATSDQTEAAVAFLNAQGAAYGVPSEKLLSDVRVWADFGHVLFNAKNFSFVY